MNTPVSVVIEAISKAQQSFWEPFTSLPPFQKEVLLALVVLILSLVGAFIIALFSVRAPRRYQRKQRQQELDTYIKRKYITSPPPPLAWTAAQLQSEKRAFFLSRSLKRDNVFSYRAFFVERELLNRPELRIAKYFIHAKPWRRACSHVNIYGNRGQGKTVLLAALFLGHSTSKGLRLWLKSPDSPTQEDEDCQYLERPIIRNQKFVALFIDDYLRGNDSSEVRNRKRNIIEAARAKIPFGQIRIIFTASDQLDSNADKNLHLFLTETEEQTFLTKLTHDTPVLVDPRYTDISYALGLLGGERQYSPDLASFLSLIVEKLFPADSFSLPPSLNPARLRDDPPTWQAVRLIAAFSVGGINTALPARLLEELRPTANIYELENITDRQIVHVHNIGFTTAPYYASKILTLEQVNAAELESMYLQVFQACIARNTVTSYDLVRQVLYRLAKGRHFTFLHKDNSTVNIANRLYLSIRGQVIQHCALSNSVATLASWAATTARLKRIDDARAVCARLLSVTDANSLHSGKDFVNVAVTQKALLSALRTAPQDDDVAAKSLTLLV